MTVLSEVKDGVAVVTLDHPPVNAPDSAGWNALADVIEGLGRDDAVRCLILAARGKGFCAGVDIMTRPAAKRLASMVSTNRRPGRPTFSSMRCQSLPPSWVTHKAPSV